MKRGEGRASTIKLLVLVGHSIGPAIYRSSETISLRALCCDSYSAPTWKFADLLPNRRNPDGISRDSRGAKLHVDFTRPLGLYARARHRGFNAFASSANSRTHLATAFALPLKERGAWKRSFDRQSFRVRLPKRFGLLKRRRRTLLGGQLLDGPDRIPCTPKVILLRRLHTC